MWDVLETFMPLFLVVRLIDSKELKKKNPFPGILRWWKEKAEEPARGGPVLTGYTDTLMSSHFCLIFPINVTMLQKKLITTGTSLFLIWPNELNPFSLINVLTNLRIGGFINRTAS